MATSNKQNIELERGKTYEMSYIHPVAMTGGTLYFTIKAKEWDTDATDDDALIKKTITSFVNSGLTAEWTLTDEDTYITPRDDYRYDIVFEDVDGNALPASWYGKVKLVGRPTNRNV